MRIGSSGGGGSISRSGTLRRRRGIRMRAREGGSGWASLEVLLEQTGLLAEDALLILRERVHILRFGHVEALVDDGRDGADLGDQLPLDLLQRESSWR